MCFVFSFWVVGFVESVLKSIVVIVDVFIFFWDGYRVMDWFEFYVVVLFVVRVVCCCVFVGI